MTTQPTTTKEALEPCPNPECGSEKVVASNDFTNYYIYCSNCFLRGPRESTEHVGVRWNALPRVSTPSVAPKQELPSDYICIAPQEQALVINRLRGVGSKGDNRQAELHEKLCLRCQELVAECERREATPIVAPEVDDEQTVCDCHTWPTVTEMHNYAVALETIVRGTHPEHKCKPIARAVMDEGRDWWIGELLEPIPEWPSESYCLHMKTPVKDVAFLCNAGDFEQLMVLGNVVTKLKSLAWLESMTEGATSRAPASPAALILHCSCGAACTPDEYEAHRAMGHDAPAALRDEAEMPRGYWPTLIDRGDGVKGHFCIGQLKTPGSPYWEFWNKGQWTSAGEVFIGHEAAQKQLDAIRVGDEIDLLDNDIVDKELRRWQDAIRDKMISMGVPDHLIDGAGCDSGDPLDFTLAEVGQGVGYILDQLEEPRAATTPPSTLAKAAAEEILSKFPELKEHDKWVTLGRVKIDIETETETFERAITPQLPVKERIAAIIGRCFSGDGKDK